MLWTVFVIKLSVLWEYQKRKINVELWINSVFLSVLAIPNFIVVMLKTLKYRLNYQKISISLYWIWRDAMGWPCLIGILRFKEPNTYLCKPLGNVTKWVHHTILWWNVEIIYQKNWIYFTFSYYLYFCVFVYMSYSIWNTLIPKSIHHFVYFHGVQKQNYVNCVTLQIVMNMSLRGVMELGLYVDLRFKDGHLSSRAVRLFALRWERRGPQRVQQIFGTKICSWISFSSRRHKGNPQFSTWAFFIRAADERVLLQWHCFVGHNVCITGLRLMSSQGKLGGLFSPHVATLQCDLALVHMLTAGSLVEGMICQPLFIKRRQHKPVR